MFIRDIDWDKFEILNRVDRGTDCWSRPIMYNGRELEIQLPVMSTTFEVGTFHRKNDPQPQYSLCLTIDDNQPKVKEFHDFIKKLNANVKDLCNKDFNKEKIQCQFNNRIKQKKVEYKPYFQIKLISNRTRFKFQAMLNEKEFTPTIDAFKEKIKTGTKVECIIQLNPIWKWRNEFGISFQLKAINILKNSYIFKTDKNSSSF
jgi:hypothetical protein